jgi:hypothetical protein
VIRLLLLAVLGLGMGLCMSGQASAATHDAVVSSTDAAPAIGLQNQSIGAPSSNACLAIDDSGSMWTDTDQGAASDPGLNPLRAQAARVFISLLGADVNNAQDGVSAVLFGSADKPGEDIITLPVSELSSNAARDALAERIDSSLWSKGWTRIDRAIDSCLVLLGAATHAPQSARIVLLTDGVPASADPRFDAEGQLRALSSTLQELRARGWAVDVILLGPSSVEIANDSGSFAARIAGATGGRIYVAQERTDLLRIYTQIVASMTGRSLVQGDSVDLSRQSRVPVHVEERTATMTVTVVKSDPSTRVTLRDPDGHVLPADAIVRTSTGLVETLTVPNPQPGAWGVELDGQGQAYVSLVLRPVDGGAVATTGGDGASPALTARWSAAWHSLVWLAIGIVGAAIAAGVAFMAVSRGWRWIRGTWVEGVVALSQSPAAVVRLEEIARSYRVLGLIQRPVPAALLLSALGVSGESRDLILADRGDLVWVRRDATIDRPGTASRVVFEPGRIYELGKPPVSLVFARSTQDLPVPPVNFDTHPAPQIAASTLEPESVVFGVDQLQQEAAADTPKEAVRELAHAFVDDADAW